MKRALPILLATLAAVAAVLLGALGASAAVRGAHSARASGGAHSARASGGAPVTLSNLVCQKALDPPARAISITAIMRPVTGTKKMEMEVQLLSHATSGGSFAPIAAPAGSKLGSWITPPNPTLGQRAGDIWKLQVPVADLDAPDVYRFSVAFRWLGASGKVLQTATRTSASCRQPELRADLYVQSFAAQPIAGHPQQANYVAVIGNDGASAAKAFSVQFADGATTSSQQVAKLGAGQVKTLQFAGPACTAGQTPTLTLDPQHVVDQSNTTNDTATATCPATSSTPSGTTAGTRQPGRRTRA